MNRLKNLLAFYVNSSIHVALAVVAFAAITFFHFGIPPDTDLLFFIFFGVVTGYNFIKFAGIAKLHHRSLAPNLKIIQIFSLFSFLALVYFAFKIKVEVLIIAALFGIFTLFYALPFFGKRNLRTIGGIKIYVIAFIWAGVTVMCPVAHAQIPVNFDVLIEFLQRVLLVLVLLIPFEIRDLKYDKADLKTLPQKVGVKGSKTAGIALSMTIFGLEFLKSMNSTASVLALGITMLVAVVFILRSKEEQPQFFSSFWVEGIPIFWLGILLLLRNFL